ncbi:MAG: glycosyltransferase [Candidatus Cloacimonetes bacterium]|nr:glycosyltransferase [Candidatus Cloacimonadota bacterium]
MSRQNIISIVSLAWNKYDLTKDFLGRLKANTDIEHELIFTDNGSEEPISELVKEYYPNAKLIRYEKNIGCPATRNPSMKEVESNIVFWLDNDTYVGLGWYKPFLAMLERDEKLGICGPFGKRVRNPWNPSIPFEEPIGWGLPCDGFMGYALAIRKKAYQPIPDWGLAVNMDDIDAAVEMKAKGWKARVLDLIPNLQHLTTQTGPGWQSDMQPVFEKWWAKWQSQAKEVFENYK